MSPAQIKIALYGGAALLAWLLTSKITNRQYKPIATVDLGVPTVDGEYGGDYYVAGGGGPGLRNPAVDQEMRRLIDKSNAAIAADAAVYGDTL